MKNWQNYFVMVFDKEGYVVTTVNSIDHVVDAVKIAKELELKYPNDFSTEIYRVFYEKVYEHNGSILTKEYKESV